MGECFFWYWPTRVVPDKRPLNGCVRVCVYVLSIRLSVCLFICLSAFRFRHVNERDDTN